MLPRSDRLDFVAFTLPESPSGEAAKALGAYYTDPTIADFLVRWAIRAPNESVLDPSFGGGVFLQAAVQRLEQLGGNPRSQIFGVEIDPQAHARTRSVLEHSGIRLPNLILGDFFDLLPGQIPLLTAVVGNPPFIRYQRFTGEGRARAMARASSEGVALSMLSSSWAPFLVHSVAMLRSGGRLGMVIPMELGHAAYARPLLAYLAQSFEQIAFITFRKKLFPSLSQDTLLLLAEGKGGKASHFHLLDVEKPSDLNKLGPAHERQSIEAQALTSGRQRITEYFLPPKARALYRELSHSQQTRRLGALADVGIGYVTGNNSFFHLSPWQVAKWGISSRYLKPAVRRGRGLSGLRFTPSDWEKGLLRGESGYLLHITGKDNLPQELQAYLAYGESEGAHLAHKCRVRDPWYAVPHVYQPDAFLTYMSGKYPRLVANEAGAVAPNNLHILRLRSTSPLGAAGLACLWQTSLTRLSAEIEGHALGGGMLKVEPREAEQVVLAAPNLPLDALDALLAELDRLLRTGRAEAAQDLADDIILIQGLGLTRAEQRLLRRAANALKERRSAR